jgi:hypothetical protein
MAGAPLTGYDVLSSTPVEAMKKPSREGGGKPSKARPRKPSRLKRNIVPKAVAHRNTATDRIAKWLEKLGLGQYAQQFVENDISFSLLADRNATSRQTRKVRRSRARRPNSRMPSP